MAQAERKAARRELSTGMDRNVFGKTGVNARNSKLLIVTASKSWIGRLSPQQGICLADELQQLSESDVALGLDAKAEPECETGPARNDVGASVGAQAALHGTPRDDNPEQQKAMMKATTGCSRRGLK